MIKKGILTMVTVLIMIIISALPIQAAGSGNYLITNMNLGLKIFGLALFLIGMGLIFFKHKRFSSKLLIIKLTTG